MASKKIHLFRQSAVKAGTPGRYYINPSEKLMSRTSEWGVVEREDGIELIFNESVFGDIPFFGKIYYNQAIGDAEKKDDDYSYIMNTDFLDVKKMICEIRDGVSKFHVPKIKVEENKKKVVGVQAK
ncbi:hypothetical protein MKW98_016954 [Papaver atlanticum]|uniref:Uncharacterized protein n=1 Tax=Papaver atlanticum TaxID=357466 RepID=A0AAD4XXS9_9MAGN|nr:hypothetical protein MKW98_016954 [Papaver atlanticum]